MIWKLIARIALSALIVAGLLGTISLTGAPSSVVAQDDEEETSTPTPAVPKPAAVEPSPEAKPMAFDPSLPAPPDVTGGVFESALTSSEVFPAGQCQTGQARGEAGEEGFRVTVAGRCIDQSVTADVALPGRGIRIGDGDLALDFKVVAGEQRAQVSVYVRNTPGKLIGASFNPATGEAKLFDFTEGSLSVIASRTDAQGLAIPSDWNRIAVRVRGSEMWLLLNDEPLLYATDVLAEPGGVGIRVLREGSPDDEDETTVVFRSLTLSTVRGGAEDRAPTYTRP